MPGGKSGDTWHWSGIATSGTCGDARADGKTAYQKRFHVLVEGPVILFGAKVV